MNDPHDNQNFAKSPERGTPAPESAKPRAGKTKKKKKSSIISTVILVVIFLAGLGILLYPTVSDYWNSRVQSRAITSYNEAVANMSEQDYAAYFDAADAYNQTLYQTTGGNYYPSVLEGYEDTLDITGTGIMGYITIEKIDVNLPIYHGTAESVLQIAAGHLEGSSLPVGGASTHCCLSAHRGLPSARLFTDLDKLEVGDTFTVTVLNRLLTYQVDQIRIVEPTQLSDLNIEEGKDYFTLMTCTPYGINSHRMLVRGVRIENAEEATTAAVAADARPIDPLIAAPIVAIPLLLIVMLFLIFRTNRKKRRNRKN